MDNYYNNSDEIKDIITENLIKYRKANKLTQLELAEKLQYSDKNISKWERGESLPDLVVLKQIADIYGITVNDLMKKNENIEANVQQPIDEKPKKQHAKFFNKQQLLICLLSVGLVWLVATITFGLLNIFLYDKSCPLWQIFIIAMPISSIVALVFTCIWCTNRMQGAMVSLVIWTTCIAFNVCFSVLFDKSWLIYIIAIPLQILTILWFYFRRVNRNIKQSKLIEK